MKRKKRMIFTCCISILLIISGCKDKEDFSDKQKKTVQMNMEQIEDKSIKTYQAEKKSTEESIEMQSPKTISMDIKLSEIQKQRRGKGYYGIWDTSDFSEGRAWVYASKKGSDNNRYYCIDTKGNIVLDSWNDANSFNGMSLEGISFRTKPTPFEAGHAAYIRDNNIYFIDTKGDCTGKLEGQYPYPTKMIAQGGGKYMILQNVESFEEAEKKIGVIDYNGNWLIELNADNEISRQLKGKEVYSKKYKFDNFNRYYKVYDAKEGMFCFVILEQEGQIEQTIFYNTETGNSFAVENMKSFEYFENGQIVLQNKETGDLYKADKEGNLMLITSNIPETIFSDGMYYKDGKFYDINGQAVLDISKYTDKNSITCIPFFSEGYGQIGLLGADGRSYWFLIDKKGEQIAGSILLDEEHQLRKVSEGCVAVPTENMYKFFDIEKRDFFATVSYSNDTIGGVSDFKNGIVHFGQSYFNKDGELVMINIKD